MNSRIAKKGFTLLELIIVITIGVVISASLAAGIITLQSIVRLDNTIREIKTTIQSVQNQSRNSFVTYDRNNPSSANEDLFAANGEKYLNLGWLISFENINANESRIIRQAIYFKPIFGTKTYDVKYLREDIIGIRNTLNLSASQPFRCNNSSFQQGTAAIQMTFKSANPSDNNNYPISCADTSFRNSDYFETEPYQDLQFTSDQNDLGTNPYTSCVKSNHNSIFFTSGYGEPAQSLSNTGVSEDCQVMIKSMGVGAGNTTALKVSKDNGSVELCGRTCEK